jgi:hypothetical protein
MTSKLTMRLVTAIVIILLVACFFISGLASYWGAGLQPVNAGQLRAGSVSGPTVGGGGPGEGK